MSKNRHRNDRSLIIGVLMVCTVAVVGVGAYIKFAPANEVVNVDESSEQAGGSGVQMFVPKFQGDRLTFERTEGEAPTDEDPRVFALNHYLRNVEAIPDDVVALTCTVDDTVATLDFNAAFDRSYGTEDEMIIINGILSVMGQFDEVSWVKFTVENKEIESLGNLELTEPLRVIRHGPIESSGS